MGDSEMAFKAAVPTTIIKIEGPDNQLNIVGSN